MTTVMNKPAAACRGVVLDRSWPQQVRPTGPASIGILTIPTVHIPEKMLPAEQ